MPATDTSATTIVLLGGSGLGPWAWERVVPGLEAFGFRVVAPTLHATGNDPTPASDVTLDVWIDDALAAIAAVETPDVVLVAHSFAGYVAAGVLERKPGIVRAAVFLDAALPTPGRSWFDVAGPGVEGFMRSLEHEGAVPFFTREQLDALYPGHGIDDGDWAWMEPLLTAQPTATYAQPATRHPISGTGTALVYVRCRDTLPPASDISADTPGWALRTLASGHWPMITVPSAVVEAIRACG